MRKPFLKYLLVTHFLLTKDIITPPARRAWQSYKFTSLGFSVLFSVSQVGLPLMGDTAVRTGVWPHVTTAFELNFYQIM